MIVIYHVVNLLYIKIVNLLYVKLHVKEGFK